MREDPARPQAIDPVREDARVEAPDGTRLAVWQTGPANGALTILCHGIGLDRRSWGEVPDLLAAAGRRVVAYDLRGHGDSEPAASGDYSFRAQAHDMGAVLHAVAPDGAAAALLGHSLGGGILLAYAHELGDERINAAVFVNTTGAAKLVPALPGRRAGGRLTGLQRQAWLAAFLGAAGLLDEVGERPRVARLLLRRVAFGADPPPEQVRFVRTMAMRARLGALAATMRATVAVDPVRWSGDLRRPTLVVVGTEDLVSPLEPVQDLVDSLPDARIERLHGAGHLAALTRPRELFQRIETFLVQAGAVSGDSPGAESR